MKSKDVIEMVRRDAQIMWEKHLNWIKSNGQNGMPCLDIPSMEKLLNRTDLEILDKALSRGMYIPDYEEYKAQYLMEHKKEND